MMIFTGDLRNKGSTDIRSILTAHMRVLHVFRAKINQTQQLFTRKSHLVIILTQFLFGKEDYVLLGVRRKTRQMVSAEGMLGIE